MATQDKSLIWVGGCKKDLMALPADVRKFFGHALDFAQRGDQHDAAKVMKGFGGASSLSDLKNRSENSAGRGQIATVLPGNSRSIAQKNGEI